MPSLVIIYRVAYVRASLSDLVLRRDMQVAAMIPHRALLRLRDNLLSIVQQQRQGKCCSDVQDSWNSQIATWEHLAFTCNSAGLRSERWGWTRPPKRAGTAAGAPPWEIMEMGFGYGLKADPAGTDLTCGSQNGADGGSLALLHVVGWDKKLLAIDFEFRSYIKLPLFPLRSN